MSGALFNQSDIWIADGGREVRIADIDRDYAANILRFLDTRADICKDAYEWWMTTLVAGPAGPRGDAANDAVDADLTFLYQQPALDWLRQTTLYRAIAERAAA